MVDIATAYAVLAWAFVRARWYQLAAILAIAVLGFIILVGCTTKATPAPTPKPPVVMVPGGHQSLPAEVTAHFIDGSKATFQLTYWEPATITPDTTHMVSTLQMANALEDAGWPRDEAGALAVAATWCEAPFYDMRFTGDGGWNVVGNTPAIGIDMHARGDRGLAIGPLAIRMDVWPALVKKYDVTTLDGAVAASLEIRAESVRLGHAPLWPWSCVEASKR